MAAIESEIRSREATVTEWLYFDREAVGMWTRCSPDMFAQWHEDRVPGLVANAVPHSIDGPLQSGPRWNRRQMSALLDSVDLEQGPFELREAELPRLIRFNADLTPESGPNGFWGVLQGAGVATMLIEPPKSSIHTWHWDAVRMPLYRNASTEWFKRWYQISMSSTWTVGVLGHASQVSPTTLEVLPLAIYIFHRGRTPVPAAPTTA